MNDHDILLEANLGLYLDGYQVKKLNMNPSTINPIESLRVIHKKSWLKLSKFNLVQSLGISRGLWAQNVIITIKDQSLIILRCLYMLEIVEIGVYPIR